MNDKIEKDVYKVQPLKKICMTIGELPTSYLDTMTYYEMLVWFTNFLRDNIIPTVNNNAEAVKELQNLFTELQNYVNNYFDNLDVQEEINNKLDKMVEDGTLQEIIADYLNSKAIFGFDTVADMKQATNLINGSYARTLGYHAKNDGGSGLYKIETVTNDDYVDGGSIIAMTDESLIARLIFSSQEVNIKQFGAYGNGINDDSIAINKAISYAKNNNLKLTSPSDNIYLISETLNIDNLNVDFNYSTIKTNKNIDIIKIDTEDYYGEIKNITLDLNSIATSGIDIKLGRKKKLKNINMVNVTTIGINYEKGYEVLANDIDIRGNETSLNSIGLYLHGSDSHWTDIIMIDINTSIDTHNQLNYVTRLHSWILNYQNLPNSSFIRVDGRCTLYMESCYADTQQFVVRQLPYESNQGTPKIYFNNLTVIYHPTIYSASHYDQKPYVFSLQTFNDSKFISLNNSWVDGIQTPGLVSGFCNISPFVGLISGNKVEHVSGYPGNDTSIESIPGWITILDNKVKKYGNVVSIEFLGSYDSSLHSGSTFIGELNYWYTPKDKIRDVAFISGGRETFNDNVQTVSCVVDTNQSITVDLISGESTKYIRFHKTYIVDNM